MATTYNGTGFVSKYHGPNFFWRGMTLQSSDQKAVAVGQLIYGTTVNPIIGRYCS